MFGDPYCKKTLLWLKGLPNLIPEITKQPEMEYVYFTNHKTGKQKRMQRWIADAFYDNIGNNAERSKARSKTFDGVARAIAQQYSKFMSLSQQEQENILTKNTQFKLI